MVVGGVLAGSLAFVLIALTGAPPAAGQLDLPPLLPTPGATPLLPPILPGILPAPSQSGAPSPSASTAAPPGPVVKGDPDTDEYAKCGAPPPPMARGKRSGPRNTNKLVSLAKPLLDRGVPPDQALIALSPPFPVAGKANFTDDWGNFRRTPCPHWHQGTDIFAAFGTPVVASVAGVVNARGRHPVGGYSLWMTGDDKMVFYYAHLEKFGDAKPGDRVSPGTVLGYVGDTGNAEGGAPHLHFSLHPPTRRAHGVVSSGTLGRSVTPYANPKPYLDSWLDTAETRAPHLIEQLGKRIDADPASATRLVSLLRPGDLAGFGQAPGAGPFGLPWSRLALIATALGIVAIVYAGLAIGRTSKMGRLAPAAEAGVRPWKPSWSADEKQERGAARGGPRTSRTAQPQFRQHDYPATERPPSVR